MGSELAFEVGRFAVLVTLVPVTWDLAWQLFVRLSR